MGVTSPQKPARQRHDDGTRLPLARVPLLDSGHGTALHVLEKNGEKFVATTVPLKPGLHMQPAGALVPLLLGGHPTAIQAGVW